MERVVEAALSRGICRLSCSGRSPRLAATAASGRLSDLSARSSVLTTLQVPPVRKHAWLSKLYGALAFGRLGSCVATVTAYWVPHVYKVYVICDDPADQSHGSC